MLSKSESFQKEQKVSGFGLEGRCGGVGGKWGRGNCNQDILYGKNLFSILKSIKKNLGTCIMTLGWLFGHSQAHFSTICHINNTLYHIGSFQVKV